MRALPFVAKQTNPTHTADPFNPGFPTYFSALEAVSRRGTRVALLASVNSDATLAPLNS
jgi:hypothetical protein